MTNIWIIHTGEKGCIHESVLLQTKHKSKVGKYIRNNIPDFFIYVSKVRCM